MKKIKYLYDIIPISVPLTLSAICNTILLVWEIVDIVNKK